MVLLNGPVKNARFCLMDRYRNVCVWFMARNCRFPKVGTHGCQRGNHRLPIARNCRFPEVGTPGSQLRNHEVTIARNCRFPEVGTHASQPGNHRLPLQRISSFLKVGTDGSQRGNQRLPWQGTAGSQTLKLRVPNAGNQRLPLQWNCWFPEVRIYVFEAKWLSLYESLKLMVPKLKKHTLSVEGSVDSKKLEFHGS